MTAKHLIFIFPLIIFIFSPNKTFAQKPAIIKGRVIDAKSNKPLPWANVKIRDTAMGAATGAQGFYEIKNVFPGKYLLEADVIGYKKQIRGVTVKPGEIAQIDFGLVPIVLEMKKIVVGARRNDPMPVIRIDSKQIRKIVPSTTGDILKVLPGVSISRTGGWGMKPYFQGMTDSRILLFVDGVKINQACPLGMDACTATLEPDLIAGIEVRNGPGSALYGSGNMGGVINVITSGSKFLNSPDFKTEIGYKNRYKSVSNSFTGLLSFSGGIKKFDFFAGIAGAKHNNYKTKKGEINNSGFESDNIHLKTRFRPNDNQQLMFTAQSYSAEDIGWPASNTVIPEEKRDTYALNYNISDISSTLQKIDVNISYLSMYHNMKTNSDPDNTFLGDSKTITYSTNFTGYWALGNKTIFTTGLFYSLWKMNANRTVFDSGVKLPVISLMPNSSLNELGFFVQDEYSFSDRMKFQTGLRLNYIGSNAREDSAAVLYQAGLKSKETIISGSAALFYNLTKNSALTASVSKGFKAATPVERYLAAPMLDGYYRIGNPNLTSETNFSKRIGLRWQQNRVNWNLEIYHNSLANLISAQVDSKIENRYPGLKGEKSYVNITEARIIGVTGSATISLGPFLFFSSNISYDWGQDITTNEPLPFIAPFNSTVKLTFDNTGKGYWLEFTARVTAAQNRYAGSYGEQATPGHTVFDINGGWKIGRNIETVAGIDNIFNRYYRQHLNPALLPEPGRSVNLTVEINFPTTGFNGKKLDIQNSKQVSLSIDGMVCSYCVDTIKERLKALPGVLFTSINLIKKTARVTISEDLVSINKIIDVITRAGFKVFLKSVNSYNEIK